MTPARVKRRLLFLLPSAPRVNATHGGARTTAQFLLELTRRHDVAVLHLRAPEEPGADEMLYESCALIEDIGRPGRRASVAGRWAHRARLLTGQMKGRPIWATEWAVPAFGKRVRAVAQTWEPHIVHIEHHIMGQYLPALAGCAAPRILTEHEPGTPAARDRYRTQRGPVRLVAGLDLLAWPRFERAIIRNVQAMVVLTERDGLALAPIAGDTPVVRIPVGAPVPARPLDPLGRLPPSLVFVGNFAHPPNSDAAVRLGRAIFPPVRARRPDAQLFLVGDQPTADVRRLASEHVVVTGRVPDVTPYLDRAAIVVAPIRMGGGMRVKVLEAITAGKALVASSLAISGLDLEDGEEFRLAESDAQFAEAIVRLLADPAQRAAIAGRARKWACDNLGWATTVGAYEALYQRLLEVRRE